MSEYRHEYKYLCQMQQLACIKNQIRGILQPDKNTGADGSYVIRSLYFDDYDNSCYYDNINGTDPREKFRIRIYNADSSYIKLELKQKNRGKTKKQSCVLTKDMCIRIIQGKNLSMNEIDSPVYRKFCLQQNTRLLRPKVIVEYDRFPYVYKDGNVRITFDLNVRSSSQIKDFFEPIIVSRPVMPINQHILEVKFDDYIPDFIYQTVQIDKLRQTTYSKYSICRRYSMRGVI